MVRPLLAAAACLLFATTAEARASVGERAPWFRLEGLTGKRVTRAQLRGRPLVLVVGRTQRAAPPCKRWMLGIIGRHGPRLQAFQVIVVDKSWYIPRSLVLGKIRGFIPARLRHRVLLEWYTVFADHYGVPKHDDPVVFVINAGGEVRWRHRGAPSAAAFGRLGRVLDAL